MNSDIKINLQVTMEEAKLIFQALGKMPFEEVYELIGDLNQQVNKQNQDSSNSQNH